MKKVWRKRRLTNFKQGKLQLWKTEKKVAVVNC